MSNSSDPSPEVPLTLILSGPDWDILMTQQGSAIACGDGEPTMLQSLN